MVCRVILGNTEVVLPTSGQSGPSSGDFDCGVDNQQSPRKYIVWYPDVKTNILPLYTLAVKLEEFHSGPGGAFAHPYFYPNLLTRKFM